MAKPALPTEIHVLDLFCGSGTRLKMLARRHPKCNFVGVDASYPIGVRSKSDIPKRSFVEVDEAMKPRGAIPLPPNLHLVRQKVIEFLRSRKQAEKIHQVNIDYGVHHLSQQERRELFAHISQLLRPGGSLHVTTYDKKGGPAARPDSIRREAEAAGLKLFKQAPFELGSSHSEFGLSAGSESFRLWFKKPREKRV